MYEDTKKKITIIGANSYIARNLLKIIEKNKFEINLYDYQKESIDNESRYNCIDLTNRQAVDKIDVNCDIIFIFSGLTGTNNGFNLYKDFIDVNEKGLLNILDRVVQANSKAKIIFPSTRLIYKGQKDVPLKEDADKEFKTLYAMNKYACENYLEMYKNVYGINYCIARICVVYGNLVDRTDSYGTIGFFLTQAEQQKKITIYGDGSQKRSFIHIYDLCQILIQLAISKKCEGIAFNIGGPDIASIAQIADSIGILYDVPVHTKEWPELALKLESGDTIFDSSKMEEALDYKYTYTYSKWLKEQGKKDR